ncbi:MAG: hypothetical protein ACE5ET_04350 [Gammaproteobacteria bacterium]
MAAGKALKWSVILLALVLAGSGMLLMTPAMRPSSPCETKPVAELVDLYPELKTIVEKQRLDTERLLSRHRAQDVMINMQMSSRKIAPEQALRLSMGQVEELAALRHRQESEFQALCRRLRGEAG